jgi:hypothetical protein
MILVSRADGSVAGMPVRLRDRLLAALQADRIDQDLALGASPDADVQSALRARALTSTRMRRVLARALQRGDGDRPGLPTVADDLERLRRRLLADGPVRVQGVAQAHLLVTSVLPIPSQRRDRAALAALLRRAADALDIVDDEPWASAARS